MLFLSCNLPIAYVMFMHKKLLLIRFEVVLVHTKVIPMHEMVLSGAFFSFALSLL